MALVASIIFRILVTQNNNPLLKRTVMVRDKIDRSALAQSINERRASLAAERGRYPTAISLRFVNDHLLKQHVRKDTAQASPINSSRSASGDPFNRREGTSDLNGPSQEERPHGHLPIEQGETLLVNSKQQHPKPNNNPLIAPRQTLKSLSFNGNPDLTVHPSLM